jgi:hypothetical protein
MNFFVYLYFGFFYVWDFRTRLAQYDPFRQFKQINLTTTFTQEHRFIEKNSMKKKTFHMKNEILTINANLKFFWHDL